MHSLSTSHKCQRWIQDTTYPIYKKSATKNKIHTRMRGNERESISMLSRLREAMPRVQT